MRASLLLSATLIHAVVGVSAGAWAQDPKPVIDWDKPSGNIKELQPFPLAVAEMYSAGQRAEAIAKLEGWSEADMKAELVSLRNQMRKMGGRLPELPLKAAVMLHTDREAYERLQAPVVETQRECGINAHAGYSRALIALVVVQSDASRDFAKRWLTAMALQSHWDLCLDDVRLWTREGLKWFPKDATFLLIQGTASEISAQLTPVPALYANPNNRQQGLTEIARRRQEQAEARRDLEAAFALDPSMHEAALRLGRVLWRVEKPAEARVPLQAVIDGSKEPALLYLAHLFLGRVKEDSGDVAGAIESYRAALAIDPSSQAAGVALSEALLVAGEDGEGRGVLGRAVEQAPRTQSRDPFMSYHLGRAPEAEAMMERLRSETLK